MAARFQAQKYIRATCPFPGLAQGKDLGMRTTGLLVPTRTNHAAFIDNHATDIGIWMGAVDPAPGQTDGMRHVLPIVQLTLIIIIIIIRQ